MLLTNIIDTFVNTKKTSNSHDLVISKPIFAAIIVEWISVTTMKTATPSRRFFFPEDR